MTEITPCSSYSRFVSGASNHISASREWENLFLFRENFMSRMWGGKKCFYSIFLFANENMISFFTILLFMPFPCSSRFILLSTSCAQKVLFHFLMHAKSNGSRHFYAPSIQHQINMKFMLRQAKSESSPLNDIPAVYSTSKRIPNVIPTCVYVKY